MTLKVVLKQQDICTCLWFKACHPKNWASPGKVLSSSKLWCCCDNRTQAIHQSPFGMHEACGFSNNKWQQLFRAVCIGCECIHDLGLFTFDNSFLKVDSPQSDIILTKLLAACNVVEKKILHIEEASLIHVKNVAKTVAIFLNEFLDLLLLLLYGFWFCRSSFSVMPEFLQTSLPLKLGKPSLTEVQLFLFWDTHQIGKSHPFLSTSCGYLHMTLLT